MADSRNEALVRQFFDKLNAEDLEGLRTILHPQATWKPMSNSDIPGAGVHVGHKGIIDEFLKPVRGLFEGKDPQNSIRDVIRQRGAKSSPRRTARVASRTARPMTTATAGSSTSKTVRSSRFASTWIRPISRASSCNEPPPRRAGHVGLGAFYAYVAGPGANDARGLVGLDQRDGRVGPDLAA